ncbi:MAG: class 1 fructose-bisphosphatase, partial [Oscillatoriales cyanobacterium SM2_1_8]|nr:class 1 fructose-bisphosphatase [Oscillatoriales cyanobacterium SM2_1_8]
FVIGTAEKPGGKLRMLYEAAPLAEIAEQAGGSATNGIAPILDLPTDRLHARTPLILGSREEVALFQRLVNT